MKTRRLPLWSALAVGAAAALAVPLHAAVADSSPPDPYFHFEAQSPAKLLAKGAAVTVPVRVTCFPEVGQSGLSVFVNQRVAGGRIATGYSFFSASPICDGWPHVVKINVPASAWAFRVGPAYVVTSAFGCTPQRCDNFVEETVIRLRK